MKRLLIQTIALTASATLLTSCFDEIKQIVNGETAPAEQTPAVEEPAAPVVPTEPTNDDICRMLMEQLSGCEIVNAGQLTCGTPTKNTDESISMGATLKLSIKEDLYARENAPAAFNKEREAVNEAANASMKPEASYLFQVGATSDLITDADRQAKPLPENLQAAMNEMKELNLPSASLYRMLVTLTDLGYIIKDHSDRYRLGRKLLSLAYKGLDHSNLTETSAVFQRSLRNTVNETVALGVISGGEGVVVDTIRSEQAVCVYVQIGHHFPLHTAAPAKAILAFLPEEEQSSENSSGEDPENSEDETVTEDGGENTEENTDTEGSENNGEANS